MDLGRLTDGLARRIEETLAGIGGALLEPVVRLGVTGLSRAGKTVFITSLVANLIDRGRMPQLRAAAEGRILAAYLQPQPDHSVAALRLRGPPRGADRPRAALAGEHPLDLDAAPVAAGARPPGCSTGFAGPRTVHLDIVDYPGEWLLDLPLMNQSFEDWSAAAIATARAPGPRRRMPRAGSPRLAACDPAAAARRGRGPRRWRPAFTGYLAAARAAGLSTSRRGGS